LKLLAVLIIVLAQLAWQAERVVLLVTMETVTEIDEVEITTNTFNRFVYETQPNAPRISYRSAISGVAINESSVTTSNRIAQDTLRFYQRLSVPIENPMVLMP